ncbi:MAG: prolyl oligopeptidase family serine peptidase [Oscillospiraceae bacterium]|nr:prolyl oligopeptidase family serine peptidase [Oscillospiraceae bacterium]
MREQIMKCLGRFPEKCDLELKKISEEDCGDYTRQLIEYQTESGERVQSYLLVPHNLKGKNPAVLAIHQHAGKWHLGKSEVVGLAGDPMFSYGLDLVKRGYVVIAPDLLCFESRIEERFNDSKAGQSDYERYEFLKRVQYGSCLQTKYLHDLSVALDVLEALDYVDTNRIGAIGHSLGGQETVWITWYDKRIKAAVSSCGVGSVASIFDHRVLHCFALYVPGLGNVCDMDEVIKEISPRALMITSGLRDEAHFPLDGIDKIEEANRQSRNFKSVRFDDGHKLNDTEKDTAYSWLDDKLNT